jgi:hypothetical protein
MINIYLMELFLIVLLPVKVAKQRPESGQIEITHHLESYKKTSGIGMKLKSHHSTIYEDFHSTFI